MILRGASLYEPTNIWPRPTTNMIRDLNARFSMQLGGISCRGSEPGLCGLCLPPIFQFAMRLHRLCSFWHSFCTWSCVGLQMGSCFSSAVKQLRIVALRCCRGLLFRCPENGRPVEEMSWNLIDKFRPSGLQVRLKANSLPVRKYFRNFRILWSNRGSLRFGPPRRTRGFFQTATNRSQLGQLSMLSC